MLGSLNGLRSFRIKASDGEIGKAADFYFDDAAWRVRYLVADTGGWLSGRQVLISPVSLERPDRREKVFPVALTREQVENSPPVETDQPVSRQQEARLATYFGWPSYWTAEPLYAPEPVLMPPVPAASSQMEGDPHLRSARAVTGYAIVASGGEVGRVDDFLADDDNWAIRYLVIDTGSWLRGRKLLLAPLWIPGIDWAGRSVAVELTPDRIRNSPDYDDSVPVTRAYESALYDFYGVAPYWK